MKTMYFGRAPPFLRYQKRISAIYEKGGENMFFYPIFWGILCIQNPPLSLVTDLFLN